MRLFIAILPDEPCKRRLRAAVDGLRGYARHGDFTKRENLHLTLAFLGEAPGLGRAQAAMAQIQAAPFRLDLAGLGRFQRPEGDLWWMGVGESPALAALQRQLSLVLGGQGFPLEERPFCPHLTLARRVRLQPGFAQEELEQALPCAAMWVDSISLMESHRPHGELVYSERSRHSLKGE